MLICEIEFEKNLNLKFEEVLTGDNYIIINAKSYILVTIWKSKNYKSKNSNLWAQFAH